MNTFSRSLLYLIVFALFSVGGGFFVADAINRPSAGSTETYTAEFTNASGLRVGNDVRLLGVRVGKVTEVSLTQHDGGETTLATVQFTLNNNQHIYRDTRLAIRYLNLTGIRYLDVQQRSEPSPVVKPGSVITSDSTDPSFDITTIFHGLAPVLSAMSPDDINHFAQSMLTLVQGDGSGFSTMLDSLSKVLRFADDRSQIIETLVNNLVKLSSSINDRSQYLGPLIDYLSRVGTTLVESEQGLRGLAETTGEVIVQVDGLLAAVGLRPNSTPDLNSVVQQILPTARSAIGLLGLTPGILNAINLAIPVPGQQVAYDCSRGQAALPASVAIFLRGAQVTLCKR